MFLSSQRKHYAAALHNATMLAFSDNLENRQLLMAFFCQLGCHMVVAANHEEAMAEVKRCAFDLILMDCHIPQAGTLLEKLRSDKWLRDIPVVMLTTDMQSRQIAEGIRAGVYYYLAKPFEEDMLAGIALAALRTTRAQREARTEVHKHAFGGLLESAHFRFRTLEEARSLAYFAAGCCPDPETVSYGLCEIMINAIEHGNLGISYEYKKALVQGGLWQQEVERRLDQAEHRHKYATLSFTADGQQITLHIKDQGKGFEWHRYMEVSPERAADPHGRGIALSNMLSFSSMQYLGSGNEVVCTVRKG